MNKYIITFLAGMASCGIARGVEVESTAGSLAAAIESPATVSELIIRGSVDATDLQFIASSMPALRVLDLSGAAIDASAIPALVFAGSDLTSVTLPSSGTLSIGDGAFAGSDLTSITVGQNVTTVGHAAFGGCPVLVSATISSPVVGDGAFAGCPALESVSFTAPASLGANAFAGCAALKSVGGSDRITAIGERAFAGCAALDAFNFGQGLAKLSDEAFIHSGLRSVSLTNATSLDSVGRWAFALMPSLKTVDMGRVNADEGVVFGSTALESFKLSQSATEVPDLAYAKAAAIDTIGLMHDNITRLGAYAMAGLSHISTFTLPYHLEELGEHAMAGMTGLHTLTSPAELVPATGEDVWHGVEQNMVNLIVPAGTDGAYKNADQWKNFVILGTSMAADIISGDELPALRARFDGDLLIVSVDGTLDITSLGLYNTAGQLLFAGTPSASVVTIDTAGSMERVFILAAILADGRNAALKIAK